MDFGRMPGSKRSKKMGGRMGGFGGGMRGLGRSSMWRIERGSLWLVLVSVAVFAACAFRIEVLEALVVVPRLTFARLQLWRLVTATFVAFPLPVLAFGALGLWWIGSFVERAIGTGRTVVLFVLSGA